MYENIVASIVLALTETQHIVYKMFQEDNVSGVEKLIQEDKDVVHMRIEGMPLLVAAYFFNLPDMAEMLLSKGANPTEKTPENKSFLEYVRDAYDNDPKKDKLIKVLEKHGYKFEREDLGGSVIRESFDFEGFHVINAGLKEENMSKLLEACSGLFRRMKKFGFGKILYGPLIVTSKDLEGKVFNEQAKQYNDIKAAALYYIQKDLVLINADYFLKSLHSNLQLLAHELGHRHYYKFMDASQRQIWTGKFEERALKIDKAHADYINKLIHDATPVKTDVLGFKFHDWSEFNYEKFLAAVSAKQAKYHLRDILDGMAAFGFHKPDEEANSKTMRKKYILSIFEQDSFMGIEWCAQKIQTAAAYVKGDVDETALIGGLKREMLSPDNGPRGKKTYEWMKEQLEGKEKTFDRLYNDVGKMIELPTSTTEYGRNNSSEDYAEAFGNFMSNLPMPQDILQLFIRVNNLKLARRKNGLHKTHLKVPRSQ